MNWTIAAVDGVRVTIACDCGDVVVRNSSTVANRMARERKRTLVSCRAKHCKLIKASGFLKSLRSTARKRGIQVDLTAQDVLRLRGTECSYCGGALPSAGGGLDRKDSALGYTAENVVSCCYDCNMAKASFFSHDEFMAAMRVRTARLGRGNAWPVSPRRPRDRANL